VLDVGGEIDLSTAPGLRARIEQLIRGGTRRLVVSLEHVGFLDSTGLSALVSARKGMREVGGRMALICSRESVLKVFTVTGLDRVFAIHASLAEAVGA
jgi:anti-sigma B factor antagonist